MLAKSRAEIPDERIPFLAELRHEMITKKPYAGLKVYHNTPLNMISVVKVEPLLLGGADVIVSNVASISRADPKAVQLLQDANVKLDLHKELQGNYDIHLDCCGELVSFPSPKYGAAELTQTGSKIYEKLFTGVNAPKYPVISVDDSLFKTIRNDCYGAGICKSFAPNYTIRIN